jgi:AAA family ATP:ADP antiporter
MKALKINLFFYSLFILLSKSLFDLYALSDFFTKYNSLDDLKLFLGIVALTGLISTIIFNTLQRAFLYRLTIIYVYSFVFLSFFGYYLIVEYTENRILEFIVSGSIIPINLLLILMQKGIISRLSDIQSRKTEKIIGIGNASGLIVSGILLMFFHDSITTLWGKHTILYLSIFFLIISIIFNYALFIGNKTLNYLQDNIQEIKVYNRFYKLLFQKYFISILLVMITASIAIGISYSFFIKINTVKYESNQELLNLLAILTIVYAIISFTYELKVKERIAFTIGIKMNLLLLPIVMFVFALFFGLNNHFFHISIENEFFFFVSIFAVLFVIFTQFIFQNIFYSAINTLYLPLDTKNSNDFYIKSSFYGIFVGIGFTSLLLRYALPDNTIEAQKWQIIILITTLVVLFLIIRLLVFKNYKTALQNKLYKESKSEISQDSYINETLNQLTHIKGAVIVRIINLLQHINPIKAKEAYRILANSENAIAQRIGIIGSKKLYLLDIFKIMKGISNSKYYASSPNRDKIEQLLSAFHEIEQKMKKNNYISQLSISKKENERMHSSLIVEHAPKESQIEIIQRLINDTSEIVVKNTAISAEKINNNSIIKSIIKKLGNNKITNAAFSTLAVQNSNYVDILDEAFNETGQTEIIQIKIIQILGKIADEKAVEKLLSKLNHTNPKIVSEAFTALSQCNIELPENKKYSILEELEETCKQIIWNLTYKIELEKHTTSNNLLLALDNEVKNNYRKIFQLLSLIYNPSSIELIRKNLSSEKNEKISYALELAAVIISDEIKPMLIPLLRPLSSEQRINRLKTVFITEQLSVNSILYDIIQKDTKWVNPWTKSCALLELNKFNDKDHTTILLANAINPDPMISEIATKLLKETNNKAYQEHISKLKKKISSIIGSAALTEIEHEKTQKQMPILRYKITEYFQSIKELSNIPGEILKNITEGIAPVEIDQNTIIYESNNYFENPFFFILFSGEIKLTINGKDAIIYRNNSFISSLDLLIDYPSIIKLEVKSYSQLYKLDEYKLIEYFNKNDEISKSIIKNTSQETIDTNLSIIKNEKNYIKY